jgi:hypothetical protein
MLVAQIHSKFPKGAAAHGGRAVDNSCHFVELCFLAGAENYEKSLL